MKTEVLLIVLSVSVIVAHWFDRLALRWRIPSVVFLLAAGLFCRQLVHWWGIEFSLSTGLLPLLGTVGLILIVFEGALDLRLDASHSHLLKRTFLMAALSIGVTGLALALAISAIAQIEFTLAFLVAMPFTVISSAVAIPSASILPKPQREFVIYESSISDIVGIMLFNALLVTVLRTGSFAGNLFWGALVMLLVGAVLSVVIYVLVGSLKGHVKFAPLFFILIGVYGFAKWIHLSPLLLVVILGLALNNPILMRRLPLPQAWHSEHYEQELEKLKNLTAEATFVVRAWFFLLLGYSTQVEDLLSLPAWLTALAIVALIFVVRFVLLRIVMPQDKTGWLVWMTPRGLITVLMFFNLQEVSSEVMEIIPKGSLALVVLLSCLVMAYGLKKNAYFVQRNERLALSSS